LKNVNGTVFLIFFVIILGFLGVAVVWISAEMGKQMGIGLGIGMFVVIILFAQQILSSIQINDNTRNLVEYDQNQAKVEEQRMKAQVVYAQSMRDTARVAARIDEKQYDQMRLAAQKMAGFLTEAEVAKVKAEMNGMGMLTDNSQIIEID